jgi:hypothetical protein
MSGEGALLVPLAGTHGNIFTQRRSATDYRNVVKFGMSACQKARQCATKEKIKLKIVALRPLNRRWRRFA